MSLKNSLPIPALSSTTMWQVQAHPSSPTARRTHIRKLTPLILIFALACDGSEETRPVIEVASISLNTDSFKRKSASDLEWEKLLTDPTFWWSEMFDSGTVPFVPGATALALHFPALTQSLTHGTDTDEPGDTGEGDTGEGDTGEGDTGEGDTDDTGDTGDTGDNDDSGDTGDTGEGCTGDTGDIAE
jgi:hypothetical protein